MAGASGQRICIDCGEPIGEGDRFLIVADRDGLHSYLHTLCFTEATFDPDRFARIREPNGSDVEF